MASERESIMKARDAYQEATSVLQSLTISSPKSQGPSASGVRFQVGKGHAAGALSPPDKLSSSAELQQRHGGDEEEIQSDESFAGLQMHETRPVAESQQPASGAWPDIDSEEAKLSLPATVLTLEKIGDRTPESSDPQSSNPESDPSAGTDGSVGSGSLSENLPDLESIMPNSSTSDCSSSPVSGEDEEGTNMKGTMTTHGTLHVAEDNKPLQGFVWGSPADLQKYLSNIVFSQRDFGYNVSDKLNPISENKVNYYYRPEKEFSVLKTIQQLDKNCGVFLCQDLISNHRFLLKRIMMNTNHRLIGTEFLTQHSQAFLPKIYGVYKEKDTISIFQEFIEGGSLMHVNWNLQMVRKMAEVLLSAVDYLHTRGLVHADIKLQNLMVRDPSSPESLVLIDFESAKHPSYPWRHGGHTLTHLPPWHERFNQLEKYDPILKTADLWAVGCVITFFLMPVVRSSDNDGVWSQALKDIRKSCSKCSQQESRLGKLCLDCRSRFLGHVHDHGHEFLRLHLGDKEYDDHNWKALKRTLVYLTDTTNIDKKLVQCALRLIQGSGGFCAQPDTEEDFVINP